MYPHGSFLRNCPPKVGNTNAKGAPQGRRGQALPAVAFPLPQRGLGFSFYETVMDDELYKSQTPDFQHPLFRASGRDGKGGAENSGCEANFVQLIIRSACEASACDL